MLMKGCWDRVPNRRPHTADALALFETASRGWISPTFEAIEKLTLGRATGQNPRTRELAENMPESGSDRTTEGSAFGPHEAGHSLPMSNGEEESFT